MLPPLAGTLTICPSLIPLSVKFCEPSEYSTSKGPVPLRLKVILMLSPGQTVPPPLIEPSGAVYSEMVIWATLVQPSGLT